MNTHLNEVKPDKEAPCSRQEQRKPYTAPVITIKKLELHDIITQSDSVNTSPPLDEYEIMFY